MRQLSKIRDVLRTVTCAGVCLLLTGCGQKGDLYFPETAHLLRIVIF